MYVCVSIVSFMYVCFVFALVRKNGIVRAPEVKPLINQSINQSINLSQHTRIIIKYDST